MTKLSELEKRIIRLETMLEAKEELIDILKVVLGNQKVADVRHIVDYAKPWVSGTNQDCVGITSINTSGWQINCKEATSTVTKPTGNDNTVMCNSV